MARLLVSVFVSAPDAESSRLGSGEGEEEVIGGILEELKVDEDDRAVGNKVGSLGGGGLR